MHHQYSWFRLDDTRIHWFDLSVAGFAEIREQVEKFLAGGDGME